MKLFLREHYLLILLQFIQFTTIVSLLMLSGLQHLKITLYSIFLSFIFLFAYLIYKYFSRRQFYNRLAKPVETLDETLQNLDQAPISEALQQLLKAQYNQFQKKIVQLDKRQEEHLKFLDLWIHQMKTPITVIDRKSVV